MGKCHGTSRTALERLWPSWRELLVRGIQRRSRDKADYMRSKGRAGANRVGVENVLVTVESKLQSRDRMKLRLSDVYMPDRQANNPKSASVLVSLWDATLHFGDV